MICHVTRKRVKEVFEFSLKDTVRLGRDALTKGEKQEKNFLYGVISVRETNNVSRADRDTDVLV